MEFNSKGYKSLGYIRDEREIDEHKYRPILTNFEKKLTQYLKRPKRSKKK